MVTGEAATVEVAREFILLKVRRTRPSSSMSDEFLAEMPASLDGLDPEFRPKVVETRLKMRAEDFSRWKINLS